MPALLEYTPGRKRDMTRLGDERLHPYLASHGYACIRVDVRGHGDSEGAPQDEYVSQEQDDGVEIIAWLAKQPWCSGKVGMFGISWGGFNSLQVAARRPPALKAIITHCSTDDRYTDDAHYMGGCVIHDMFVWGSMFTTFGVRPPDPAIVGSRWREVWRERLENVDFHVGNWLTHQHRDAFWKHGSINENYDDIECAVYAVGGWVDAYSSAVPRMLSGLRCPRKGLIGPWGHQFPHLGDPGPAIDWLTEALRWWDHWLKDRDTGIMDEPMLRVWMQDETAMIGARQIAGRWIAEEHWPEPRIGRTSMYLNENTLEPAPGPEVRLVLRPRQTTGVTAGHWCPFNMDTELPTDQRIDDARSLVFESAPLEKGFEILGAPAVELDLTVDQPVAFLAVRLGEVEPGGIVRRVTYGILNACHRNGHEFPKPLEPGKRDRVRVQLHDIAHAFGVGSRIRVAVSAAYWPMIWPSPEAVTLTLYAGASLLELPVRPLRAEDRELTPFDPARVPAASGASVVEPASPAQGKRFDWDVAGRQLRIQSRGDSGRFVLDAIGTELSGGWDEITTILDQDPASATLKHRRWEQFRRSDWDARVETELRLRLTRDEFRLAGEIRSFEGGRPFVERRWELPISRQWL